MGRPIRTLLPAAGTMAAIMSGSRCRRPQGRRSIAPRVTRREPRRGASRPKVAPRDQLGDNADRDLRHRLRADIKADRRRDALQMFLGDTGLAQVFKDQADLAAAADQSHVRCRRRRQVIEGLLVVPVPAGHDQST